MPTAMILQAAEASKEGMQARDYQRAHAFLQRQGYEVLAPCFSHEWFRQDRMDARGVRHRPLVFHAKLAEVMSRCDVLFCVKGWEQGRMCKQLHADAVAYGVTVLYEV